MGDEEGSSKVKIEVGLKEDNEDNDEVGWVFNAVDSTSDKKLKTEDGEPKPATTSIKRNGYDPNAWNPMHSGSQYTPLWEILALRKHFHPGVAHLADDLLHLGVRDEYKGDPLEDFTLLKFLDRFAYKNPKNQSCGETQISEYY